MIHRAAALLLLAVAAASNAAPPPIEIINEAGVPAQQVDALTRQLDVWTPRVYDYLHSQDASPIKLVLTRQAGPGFYVEDKILISPDDSELLETWIHELTHHVTGHDSSFFFKEGIATRVVEALFAREHRVPAGWPQYGKTNDAWVNLYLQRKELMSLSEALAWPQYDGASAEGDFHSWQVYCIGGSFVGWYIGRYGYDMFLNAFRNEAPEQPVAELEREWLKSLREKKLAAFDPAKALPDGPRYRRFTERLRAP